MNIFIKNYLIVFYVFYNYNFIYSTHNIVLYNYVFHKKRLNPWNTLVFIYKSNGIFLLSRYMFSVIAYFCIQCIMALQICTISITRIWRLLGYFIKILSSKSSLDYCCSSSISVAVYSQESSCFFLRKTVKTSFEK